jgi:hypothetical protein
MASAALITRTHNVKPALVGDDSTDSRACAEIVTTTGSDDIALKGSSRPGSAGTGRQCPRRDMRASCARRPRHPPPRSTHHG